MNSPELIPHLFRTEFSKIVSVLCKCFGFEQIETAEDIASDTFLTAVQSWGIEGIPPNPAAWLYAVAKNKAKNFLHRQSIYRQKITPALMNEAAQEIPEIDLSSANIQDSQLQMMFAICHPSISIESQISLSLRLLCGFGIEEIADAFLSNKETINKRLLRAKEKLRIEKIAIEMPSVQELEKRLDTVLTTIYLLFNEGYYSISQERTLRHELCYEAMRLCTMLIENESTNKPSANALLAMMCFHASRFDARVNDEGESFLYEEQDFSLWNKDLIAKGGYFLQQAGQGNKLSKYHIEAAIAYWNTQQVDSKEKWLNILSLYNSLLNIEYSPVAALNRVYASSKVNGKEQAIAEAEELNLTNNHFYYLLLGVLYSGVNNEKAITNLNLAYQNSKTSFDKRAILRKIEKLR